MQINSYNFQYKFKIKGQYGGGIKSLKYANFGDNFVINKRIIIDFKWLNISNKIRQKYC